MKRERTPIRTTDKDGIAGIIAAGKPAGYWIAQSAAVPRTYTGVVADGHRAVRKHGTFGEVLEWLHRKAGILRDARADRVIRDSSDVFCGLTVTHEGAVRIPEDQMRRARVYSGFSAGRLPKAKHGKPTAEADGIKHGNTMRNKDKLEERDEKIKEIVLSGLGMTAKKVAAQIGMKEKTCAARITALRKAGELPPADPRSAERAVKKFWTPEEDARILALIGEGRNGLQIAAELCGELNRTEVAISGHARRLRRELEGGAGHEMQGG